MVPHRASPAIRKVDAVMVPVPDLDSGLRFYRDRLGHQLLWRDDELGQAGLGLPDTDTEMVLTTRPGLVPAWLVDSADDATAQVVRAGGRMVAEPVDVPVGRLAVVADPFGNELVLIDLSKGTYVTDASGAVTGVRNPAG
ncbi:putative enzyme related to lactoylglutathione lyase [Nonomuraea fuscirosea]|uniref:Putative enzyme related to lactoylglutathione lyase n=1 Tax=Nonomuraea fuscirosea TaxID=1291556 RepID=A0A2T0NCE7_9ACTN|nr:VOC family protein [Nonomuraea fuscirosea]PRX70610.1 putative enzyme related to lactoylglutathione lyase [Nonomuraea fuscirosea]